MSITSVKFKAGEIFVNSRELSINIEMGEAERKSLRAKNRKQRNSRVFVEATSLHSLDPSVR